MAIDIKDQRFGRLVAQSFEGFSHNGYPRWLCLCDCGKTLVTRAHYLRGGKTRSCGCLKSDNMRRVGKEHPGNVHHGHARELTGSSRTYGSWKAMISRCTNPRNVGYYNYGGRGIKVCERWQSFPNFLADMGERPNDRTLDRFDNNKDYAPGNCRWATRLQQTQNRRPRSEWVRG